MKRLHFAIILLETFVGCSEKKIEITAEYIIAEKNVSSIQIKKMKVKNDSTLNPLSGPDQDEILAKLEIDSSFTYSAVMENWSQDSDTDSIFFTKHNGFYWWTDKGISKTKTLGKLEKNTWYEITGLTYYYYVVYVDTSDRIPSFFVVFSFFAAKRKYKNYRMLWLDFV